MMALTRLIRQSVLRVREFADKAFYIFNHMVVTYEEGATLVQAFRGDIQNAFFTIARFAARLLGQEGRSDCIRTADAASLAGGWRCLGTGRSRL